MGTYNDMMFLVSSLLPAILMLIATWFVFSGAKAPRSYFWIYAIALILGLLICYIIATFAIMGAVFGDSINMPASMGAAALFALSGPFALLILARKLKRRVE